jgi:hypothetical protein
MDLGAASHGKLEGDAWAIGVRVFEQYIVELLVGREYPRMGSAESVADPDHFRTSGLVQGKARLATKQR